MAQRCGPQARRQAGALQGKIPVKKHFEVVRATGPSRGRNRVIEAERRSFNGRVAAGRVGRRDAREDVEASLTRATHSAVAGSMIPLTCEILLAGKPPNSA